VKGNASEAKALVDFFGFCGTAEAVPFQNIDLSIGSLNPYFRRHLTIQVSLIQNQLNPGLGAGLPFAAGGTESTMQEQI
jgi:hypothetical protein